MSSCINFNGFRVLSLRDESWVILKSIFVLRLLSILGGRILSWLIFPFYSLIILPFYLKFLVIFVCIIGGLLGYFLYRFLNIYYLFLVNLNIIYINFVSLMWFIPILFSYKLNFYFLNKGIDYIKRFDFGWNEIFSGGGVYNLIKFYSLKLNILEFNQLKRFFLSILRFILLLLILIFLY